MRQNDRGVIWLKCDCMNLHEFGIKVHTPLRVRRAGSAGYKHSQHVWLLCIHLQTDALLQISTCWFCRKLEITSYYRWSLLAAMAINKAKVAIGFIVAGTLTVLFGAILLFVGPAVMKDQVTKVSSDISGIFILLFLSWKHLKTQLPWDFTDDSICARLIIKMKSRCSSTSCSNCLLISRWLMEAKILICLHYCF